MNPTDKNMPDEIYVYPFLSQGHELEARAFSEEHFDKLDTALNVKYTRSDLAASREAEFIKRAQEAESQVAREIASKFFLQKREAELLAVIRDLDNNLKVNVPYTYAQEKHAAIIQQANEINK